MNVIKRNSIYLFFYHICHQYVVSLNQRMWWNSKNRVMRAEHSNIVRFSLLRFITYTNWGNLSTRLLPGSSCCSISAADFSHHSLTKNIQLFFFFFFFMTTWLYLNISKYTRFIKQSESRLMQLGWSCLRESVLGRGLENTKKYMWFQGKLIKVKLQVSVNSKSHRLQLGFHRSAAYLTMCILVGESISER